MVETAGLARGRQRARSTGTLVPIPSARLRWFRDRAVNGTIQATEEEAAPHFDTLDRACAAHLANDEEPSSTF
jgi:hypothetical protein